MKNITWRFPSRRIARKAVRQATRDDKRKVPLSGRWNCPVTCQWLDFLVGSSGLSNVSRNTEALLRSLDILRALRDGASNLASADILTTRHLCSSSEELPLYQRRAWIRGCRK